MQEEITCVITLQQVLIDLTTEVPAVKDVYIIR